VLAVLSILLLLFLICSIVDILRRKHNRNGKTQLIEIFSVLTVIRLLESRSERNNERVKTFSGVKALSLAGIALTNLGIIAYFAPTTSFYSQTQDESIYACFYGVDIWLMTSGFFLSYILLKQYHKLKDKKVLLLKILRRFLRLWPIYLICLFLNWNALPLIGSGPLWPLLIDFPQKYCSTYIPHLFMLSNLSIDRCYNALWPLELDFQLCFIFVPLLILYINAPKSKTSRYVFYILQIIFLGSALGAGFAVDESKVRSLTQYFFLTEYYDWNNKPFVRCGGFLLGYNLGILYFQFKKGHHKEQFWLIKLLNRRIFRIGLPLLGLLGLLGVAISFHNINNVTLSLSYFLYFSTLRTIVPLLVIMVILPSLFGYCSIVKTIS
jgi:peptidoglycan/LPS O-acetylase OafA/YrhL